MRLIAVLAVLVATCGSAGAQSLATNPQSSVTLPSTTTPYPANSLIANNPTAGGVVVPSLQFSNTMFGGGAAIMRLRLASNDSTSTSWGGVSVQVDLWSSPPTFTNGDRGTWLVATGSATHIGSYSCAMSAMAGDGSYAECAPSVASTALQRPPSGNQIYWTLEAVTASGVTGASKVFTLTAEMLN